MNLVASHSIQFLKFTNVYVEEEKSHDELKLDKILKEFPKLIEVKM